MSSNIVLPDLPNWVQQRVTALYSAKTAEDFSAAFDAFISQNVSIKVNGKPTSRAQYKQMIQGEITEDVGAQVSFNGIVSVPSDDKDLRAIGTGSVGALFDAEVFGKFFVFGAPQANTVSSSLNVLYVSFVVKLRSLADPVLLSSVIQDPSLHHHQVGRGGAFDGRRVSELDEVLTDVPNKITPPGSGSLPPATSS
ncbi:hypothetical protein C8T65DRAFT_577417 [Cerioporus squamosus]|nr:hypothetical protein C8T65DRAFT_577417 [Cerioporus squamosus]